MLESQVKSQVFKDKSQVSRKSQKQRLESDSILESLTRVPNSGLWQAAYYPYPYNTVTRDLIIGNYIVTANILI